jgi:hypothetical protein
MRRRIILALAIAVTASLAAALTPAIARKAGADHLPNLRTRKPFGLHVTIEGGQRLLRFTNTVANVGQGPLELRPENVGDLTTAYQRIYTHDDAMQWQFKYEVPIGTFIFHPQHNHWHFEAFAQYQLFDLAADGSIGTLLREAEDKVSFCVADGRRVNSSLKHAALEPVYPTSCSQDAWQGLSVGWADRYGWRLYGQWIDITGLPDGTYWLVSTADPTDLILETRNGDNAKAIKVKISGTSVSTVA